MPAASLQPSLVRIRRLAAGVVCGLALLGARLHAQQATWSFSANTGAPTALATNISGGTITATNATLAIDSTSASSGYSGVSGGNNANVTAVSGSLSTATSSYFEFTLTPAGNRRIVATALSLGSRSTGTGPTKLTLYSSADGFATALATATVNANSNWALVSLSSFSVNGLPATSLTFRLYGSDGTGSGAGNWRIDDVTLTTSAATPTISTSPATQTVTSGQPVNFTVTATGISSLTYQWRKGGTAISGATNSSLSFASVATTDAGSYDVVVSDSGGNATSTAATLTVNKISTTLAFGALTAGYDGASHAATVTPTPSSGVTLSTTYTGIGGTTYAASTTAPVNAGTYTVSTTITDTEHVVSGGSTATLTINPDSTATIALGGLAQTYNGSARVVTATSSSPTGLATTVTYTGTGGTSYGPSTTAPTNAGTYSVAAAFTNANYGGTATGALTVSPATATITLGNLTATYDGAAHAVTVTTSPTGLPVNLTYNGSPTAPANVGTYPIVATIGATNYTGTNSASSLVIAQAAQFISFNALTASPAIGTPFTISATANSGLTPVTFAIFSGNATATGGTGSTITLNDGLDVVIRATQAGDLNYAAATADLTVRAGLLPQTILFAPLSPRLTTEPSFTLNATASSGLSVSYSILSGPATVVLNTVLLNGTPGTVIVRASQPGNLSYLPASADQSFVVSAAATAPTITTQPATQTVNAGASVDFTVVATGSPTPTYQWRRNGVDLSGATNATLSIGPVSVGDVGDYDVMVTNSSGSILSAKASLLVPAAPLITTQPVNLITSLGATATLSVGAISTPAPTYQWRKAGTVIAGATNATLTFAPVALADAASYDVVITNSFGSVTSTAATLTISRTAQAITFAAPATSYAAGASVRLDATASSGLPVTFVLVSGSGSISGGTLIGLSSSVIVRATQAGNAGYDAATPVEQTFTFFSGGTTPFLLSSPTDQTVNGGANVTLAAAAIGTPTPTWQWQKDGVAIAGATNSSLALSAITIFQAGRYTVTATNPLGTVSASAVVTVRSAPVISAQPVSQTAFAGERVSFGVVAGANPAASYQWRRNGTAIAGATFTTFTLGSVTPANAGSYDVVITNSLGAVTSSAATLTVNVRNFAGQYFGTFAGAAGNFALHVRADGTAAFLGFLPGLGTGLVTLELRVDLAGNFSLPLTTAAMTPGFPTASVQAGQIAAAPRSVTLSGRLDDASGAVTGSVPELGATLGGARASATGAAAGQAGFYQAAIVGTASTRAYVIIGADGQAIYVSTTGTSIDGAKATLAASGRLTVTTSAQASVDLGFNAGALTGTVATTAGTATVAGAPESATGTEHLVNLSVRAPTGPGAATLITGFVVTGTTSKQVLIRASGPAIAAAPFNVAGALANPVLQVFRGATVVAQNDNWGTPAAGSAAISTAAASVGAFPFAANSADSALLTTLAPGAYTAQVSGGAGITLAEVYEVLETAETAGTRRLANLSARGAVAPGAPLIAGFVIGGTAPQRVLVRGVGPTLAGVPFNVPGTLANPVLTVFRGTTAVKTNDDWFRDPDAALVGAAAVRVGAFALGAQSLDAAVLVYLEPGAYTAQVTGTGANASGGALIEIYEAP